jgi:HK97 family phage portal protein
MEKKNTLWNRVKLGIKIALNDLPRLNGMILGARTWEKRASVESDPYGIVGWAFFAMNRVARAVSKFEPELYNLNSKGDLNEIFDHPLLASLYRANVSMTKRDLFKLTGIFLYMWGSAPWYIEWSKNGKEILSIWPVRPDLLRPVVDRNTGQITKYEYRVAGQSQDFSVDEILNLREPNPASPHLGQSTLFSASLEIDADLASAVWNRYLLENRAEPGGVLQSDQELSDDAFERIKATWESRYGGPGNAGKMAILEMGLKYSKTSQTQQELDFIESRKFNRDTILTLLGIPTSLVDAQANRANADTAERTFAMNTVDPIMDLIASQISEFLLPKFSDTLWLSYETPYQADADMKRADATAGINNWFTPNEVREMYNKPPLDNGDYIYRQFSEVPTIGNGTADALDTAPAPATDPTAKGHEFKGVQYKLREGTGFMGRKHLAIKKRILGRTHIKRKIIDHIAKTASDAINLQLKGSKPIPVIKLRAIEKKVANKEIVLKEPIIKDRKIYLKALPKRERKFKKSMRDYFIKQEREVLENLKKAGDPVKRGQMVDEKAFDIESKSWISKVLFDKTSAISALVKLSTPQYQDNITEGGKQMSTLLGVPYEDLHAIPAVVDYMKSKPMFFSEQVTDTTLVKLQDSLAEGLSEGESIGELGDRVSEVFDIAKGFRTETIARTEVGSSLNFGRDVTMKDQGVEQKQWICIFSNSRDDHEEAHGQTVNIDEKFQVGDDELDYPQDPAGDPSNIINCQCNSAPVI